MPEALAIVAVFAVVAIAFVGAWLQERNPAIQSSQIEVERLRHHAAWLEQRLELAQRENWDERMVSAIAEDREATRRRLAELGVGRSV